MKKQFYILITSCVELISLIYLFLIKYRQQGLDINHFNLFYIGNILNIIFSVGSIILVLSFLFISRKDDQNKLRYIMIFSLVTLILLFIIDFFYVFKLDRLMSNIFGAYSDKVFIGIFFLIFQFINFVIFYSLMNLIFTKKKNPIIQSYITSALTYIFMLLIVFVSTFFMSGKITKSEFTQNKVDAVVVMGAAVWHNNQPSEVLMGRILKAKQIWDDSLTERIIMTGGSAPGENSEAKVAKKKMINLGVPTSKVYMEEKTSSTIEQVSFMRNVLKNNKKIKRIMVVSDNFHLLRIYFIAKFNEINLYYCSTDTKFSFNNELWFRTRETISIILYCLFGI